MQSGFDLLNNLSFGGAMGEAEAHASVHVDVINQGVVAGGPRPAD